MYRLGVGGVTIYSNTEIYVYTAHLCVLCPPSLDCSQLCVIPLARWESVSQMTLANVLADTVGVHAAFQVFPCTVYTPSTSIV